MANLWVVLLVLPHRPLSAWLSRLDDSCLETYTPLTDNVRHRLRWRSHREQRHAYIGRAALDPIFSGSASSKLSHFLSHNFPQAFNLQQTHGFYAK